MPSYPTSNCQPLAHAVFFTLNDQSESAAEAMVAACHEFLTGHDGATYFSVGRRVRQFDRDVNDQVFDIALYIVFANQAAHDAYQTHPRHTQFIDKMKGLWERVRVFDSFLAE